jgi:endogenous inhibitor of DNA gyrase (YacG/DUF329 family)
LTCTQCGKSYDAKPYMAAKSERHFCGFACYGEWQRTHRVGAGGKRVTVQCSTCGKDIVKTPSAIHEFNFCSRECFGKWRSSEYWIGANSPRWRGGSADHRGANWNRQRALANRRDHDTCQHCGLTEPNLPVHHIRPFRLFSDYREANRLENLITLCKTCHGMAEHAFWADHPELSEIAPFPIVSPVQVCRSCGHEFTPRSGATVVCDTCCTATCAHCGQEFYSRKAVHRTVKYCSKDCRNAAVKADRTRVCPGCGVTFIPDRDSTKYCSHTCRMTSANPRRQFFAARKRAVQASGQTADEA